SFFFVCRALVFLKLSPQFLSLRLAFLQLRLGCIEFSFQIGGLPFKLRGRFPTLLNLLIGSTKLASHFAQLLLSLEQQNQKSHSNGCYGDPIPSTHGTSPRFG